MEIKRSGSQTPSDGPKDYFTGRVCIDPLFRAEAPARAVGVSVTFEPGARTAWHTHPLGQTLIVTAGCVTGKLTSRRLANLANDVAASPPALDGHGHQP